MIFVRGGIINMNRFKFNAIFLLLWFLRGQQSAQSSLLPRWQRKLRRHLRAYKMGGISSLFQLPALEAFVEGLLSIRNIVAFICELHYF